MTTQHAKDGELVKDPNDHLGIIIVETGRLMNLYGGLERSEVLSELYIILHRCCQLYDESEGFTFATYTHAACRISRRTVVNRIKTGKRSQLQMDFDREAIQYDEQWQQVGELDEGLARVDDLDEIDYLLTHSNPIGVEAIYASEFDGETQKAVGERFGLGRSRICELRARAISSALLMARDSK